jgi:hypothetical protein
MKTCQDLVDFSINLRISLDDYVIEMNKITKENAMDEEDLISVELLSDVLELDIIEVWDNALAVNYKYNASFGIAKDEAHESNCDFVSKNNIDVYRLAHRCKEWAYKKGFQLASYKSEHIWITKEPFKPYPYEGAETEPESIIKACEWILKND